MSKLKGFIVSYLAVNGLLLAAPFFLVLVSMPAVFVGAVLSKMGVSEEISQFGMLGTVFVSIYLAFNIYSAIRMFRIERQLKKMDKNADEG